MSNYRSEGLVKTLRQMRGMLRGSPWANLKIALQTRTLNLVLFPNVHTHLERSISVGGTGKLEVGKAWSGGRYYPSEFIMKGRASLRVHGNFSIFTGCHIAIAETARMDFGSGYINGGCSIDCFEEIAIGEDVAISKGVTIRDSDNHEVSGGGKKSAPIRIGNHVWIGLNSTVLKGVAIGDGAIVAAGAVVTRNVPERSLVAGVPARIVKTGIDWK